MQVSRAVSKLGRFIRLSLGDEGLVMAGKAQAVDFVAVGAIKLLRM